MYSLCVHGHPHVVSVCSGPPSCSLCVFRATLMYSLCVYRTTLMYSLCVQATLMYALCVYRATLMYYLCVYRAPYKTLLLISG